MAPNADQDSAAEHARTRQASCPTPTAHKRPDEAHRWWHGCLSGYDDPPGFRANLNSCLQALRNVTCVLQKERRLVPGFESWYPEWQQRMSDDSIMVWLVKSRNRVVKMGDLDLLSSATMRLELGYRDVADSVETSLPGVGREVKKSIPPDVRPSEYTKFFLNNIPSSLFPKRASLSNGDGSIGRYRIGNYLMP